MRHNTPRTPKYCLIVPHYAEAIMAFMNVIRALPRAGLFPLVLVDCRDEGAQNVCQQHGIDMEIAPGFSWRNQLKSVFHLLYEPLRTRRYCRALFRRYPIEAVLLVDDRRYTELFLIEAARRLAVPCIVVMWAATNTASDMVAWRQKSLANLERSGWRRLSIIVRRLAPQALQDVDGRTAYWQHPLAILTLTLFARYPPQPWVLGGGTADAIAVIGDHYHALLTREGVPAEKVFVTGHPRHDDLVRLAPEWRQRAPERPYILLAAPPIAHVRQGTRGGHIAPEEMDAYLHEVIEALLSLSYDLVVKVHPRDAGHSPAYLDGHSRSFRVFTDAPIAPLIANAALLVCQGSSVVFDACGLDVPVVTFDFYNTPGYDMWQHAGVALHVTQRGQFTEAVRAALFDQALRERLRVQRARFVADYMKLDGGATERILSLIHQLRSRAPHGS